MAPRIRDGLIAVWLAVSAVCCRSAPPPFSADAAYRDAQARFRQGDLTGAVAVAEQAARQVAGRGPAESWRFLLVQAEAIIWQGHSRDALKLLEPDPPPDAGVDIAAQRATLQALACIFLQQFSDADAHLKKAHQLAAGTNPELAIDIALADGWVAFFARTDFTRAREAFEEALGRARAARQPFLEVNARGGLGLVEMRRYRFAEAADWFQSALAIARNINARASVAKSLGNLGWSYMSVGELDRALDLFTEAQQESAKLGLRRDEEIWLTNLGVIHENRRDFVRAEAEFLHALDIARELENKQQMALIQTNLASVLLARGDIAKAGEYNEASLVLKRAIGDHSSEQYSIINQGHIAARREQRPEAERIFQSVVRNPDSSLALRAEAQADLARLHAEAGDAAAAEAQFRDALRTMGEARATIRRDDFKLPTMAVARTIYEDYIDFLMAHGKVAAACGVAETARAQTLKEGLGLSASGPDGDRNAERCPSPASGVVLAYWLGPERSYLWMLTPSDTAVAVLPPESRIAALVAQHRSALMGPHDALRSGSAAGIELYGLLVSRADKWVARDPHVTIVPDGVLCGLNFETLIAPAPEPHYWIADASVIQAGAMALTANRRLAAGDRTAPATPSLLLVGNPSPASETYPALPHAAAEIDGVSRHFAPADRTVLVGTAATPAAYAEATPGRFTFIHFVAHATASRTSPLDSAIVLAQDGRPAYLSARTILTVPLQARLITVSACDSAGTRAYAGEGLVGLSWAFLRAGAHEVVAALWQVDDASTAALMTGLYQRLMAGEQASEALRGAKLAMLQSTSVYRKPYYWASFVLYSGA
jgi:CHAT domain-containing protein/tetratricopeptide (TPR) repeat protein